MTNVMKLALPLVLAATGCIPVHEYEGEYEMTYDVVMAFPDGKSQVRAGLADVDIREGLNTEYLLDLGADFCQLAGTYVEAKTIEDWPFLDIRPQQCWFNNAGTSYAMSLTGSATLDERQERLTIVLGGTFSDDAGEARGSATIELTESW